MKYLIINLILSLGFATPVLAAGLFDSKCINAMSCIAGNCANHNEAKIRHLASGQNADLMPKIDRAVQQIYKEIAPKLGLVIPNTTITHLSATDMAALAMNGGHPAPHWIDGKKVLSGATSAAGIYEFVTPGVHQHQQYIRDTNTFHETLLVLAHVAGHYDFAEVTPYFKQRGSDQVEASMELAKYMEQVKHEVDSQELSEWYHKLNTLSSLQDITRGSHRGIENFMPENIKNKKMGPTESLLQAFVVNLPADTPAWKINVAQKFEKTHRSMGAYLQTKTMNEGWATMMEYIVLKHSEWRSSADATEFAQINAGVVAPSISNPYWLGLQAWNNLYTKFISRPEVSKLSEIEKDARFISYAHEIIKGHTDYSFIRMALDSRWVEGLSLLAYKKEDLGWQEQKKVVSRDGDRIVDLIANSTANRDIHFPKIELHDLNYKKTGVVVLKHNVVEGIPLNPRNLAQALYTLANIIGAKVKLETIAVETWNFFVNRKIVRIDIPYPPYHWDIEQVNPNPFNYEKMSIEVSPTGEVKVDIDHADKTASEKAQRYFQKNVIGFQNDLEMSYDNRKSNDLEIQTMAAEGAFDVVNSLKRHAPTAASAVMDYLSLVKRRMQKVLEMSVRGQSKIKFKGGSVQIRLLPEVPEIGLDQVTMQKRSEKLSQDSQRPWWMQFAPGFSYEKPSITFTKEAKPIKDEDLDIGRGPGRPGDVFDRKPKEESQGEGEGEEPGEPGDKPGGREAGPGGDPRDPNYEEIPMDVYGKVLAQEIKLRNLRKTSGENERQDDLLIGSERRSYGDIVIDKTALEAFAHGKAMEIINRRKNPGAKPLSAFETLKNGLRIMPEEEQRVRSREPEPEPDFDAVVIFVADTSGSMGVEERKIERLMVRNQVALLKSQYKKVKIHFIIYGGSAKEVSEKEFFSAYMGDGTTTSSGIDLAREILKKYPRSKYNRFVQVFSDGDDSKPQEAASKGRQLASEIEYFAYGAVHGTWRRQGGEAAAGELSRAFEALSAEKPKDVGYAILIDTQESIFDAIKKWFGKN